MSLISKAKKLFVSFLLSCTMLTPFSASTAQERPTRDPSHIRIDNPVDQLPKIGEYPDRVNGTLPGMTVIAANQPEKEVPLQLMLAWHNMQTLKNSNTFLGPKIYNFSVDAKVLFNRDSIVGIPWSTEEYLSSLPSDTAALMRKALDDLGYTGDTDAPTVATWKDDKGLVTVGPMTDTGFMLCAQTHELIHGIQRTTGVKQEDLSMSVWDFQAFLLSYEAAANVGENIIALELYYIDKREKAPWKYCLSADAESLYRVDSVFYDAIQKKTYYPRALEEAGRAAFYCRFEQQWWLDAYNGSVFCRYLDWAMQNQLKPLSSKHYGVEQAKKTGYISEDFNLTAKVDSLPSNMFGNNDSMRQAFDWVNLLHIEKTAGKESVAYKENLKKLEDQKNPYLGVDPRIIYLTLEASRYKLSVTSVLDYYANNTQQPAPGDHLFAPKSKINRIRS